MYSSDDELPQPPGSRSPSPPLPLNTAAFRKRSYGEASTTSSDMPCFSSDDLADASIGNYASPRYMKRQYRGTWWESESSSAATRKDGIRRAAKRAKDSGVFMPSSDSSGPEEGFGYNQLKPVTPPKKESSTISPKRVAQSGAPTFFRHLVEECLEDNNETIDAQNMGIETLPEDAIKLLHHMVHLPRNQSYPYCEDAYESFNPEIKLFLSKNLLTRLPGEITNLATLKVLSLRNNQLTELPHSFGRLINLAELNVSFNKLRWLPYEMLSLVAGKGKLVGINTSFNPWIKATTPNEGLTARSPGLIRGLSAVQIQEQIDDLLEEPEFQERSCSSPKIRQLWSLWIQLTIAQRKAALPPDTPMRSTWTEDATSRVAPHHAWKKDPIFLGSSHITFFETDGTVTLNTSKHFPAPSTITDPTTPIPVQRNGPTPLPSDSTNSIQHHHGARSLFSLALTACSSSLFLSSIDADLTEAPEQVRQMLHLSHAVAQEGGRKCSVCQKEYIMPAAEWVEYWHCSPDVAGAPRPEDEDLYLPFLRRSCGWGCAVGVQREREELGLCA